MSKEKTYRTATRLMYFGIGSMVMIMTMLRPLLNRLTRSSYGEAVIFIGTGAVAYLFILLVSLPAAIFSWRMSLLEPGLETTPAFIGRAMVGLALVLPFLIYASHS
ncbi:hypothetical protein [Massilia phyllosphaerae]|uniref:hypothetical protein n=1 Tax=Massilia phyllosphaerae TaxID=3106034 RepID=UPI002B1CC2F5|nr:hypothetical protein [Massilia sp. SGZ-792]